MRRHRRAGIVAAIVTLGAALPGSAQDFYETRLRAGGQALAAGRAAEAADDLRVASFGLLDKPRVLAECLAALAVAQVRAHRSAEADATLQRFRAVQTLFPGDADLASVSSEVRGAFETFARQRIPGFTLKVPESAQEARGTSSSPGAGSPPATVESKPAPPPPMVAAAAAPASAPAAAPPPAVRTAPPPPPPAVSRTVLPAESPPPVTPPAPSPAARVAASPSSPSDAAYRTRRAVVFAIEPDQARLYVDGHYVGVAADWGFRGGKPFPFYAAGRHAIRAVLPGHRELDFDVLVDETAPADAVTASGRLVRVAPRSFRTIRPPDYATVGRVAFGPELRGAQVAVDGQPSGSADRFTAAEPMRLPGPAVHEVVLSRAGRPPRTVRVLAASTAGRDLVVIGGPL